MYSWTARLLVLLIVWDSGNRVTADELDVEVTIENLDFRQPKVTVSYDGKSRELDIAPDSAIEINGRKTDYRSMLPGDQAKVTYHKDRKLVTKIVIQRELMAPAEKLAEGWEEIDPRLIFLMIRLANVEATLEAIEKATEKKGVRVVTVERDAKRADRANEDMDRNAGGPLKWSQFYGMTAEKFFYYPTDRNSSYHTVTVLNQQGSQADNKVGGGVPSSQGMPVHQRPPQFDYIYRANEKARGRAETEILELRGKLDQLAARRQRLEAEQAGLWVEIAFHSMLHFDLDKNPMYRYEPLLLASDTDSRNNAETLKAATEFMALVLSIIKEADRDQSGTFTRIKPAVVKSRQSMMDTYLRLAVDVTDKKTSLGRFYALAKRIDEVASNLTDSYVVAMEGDSSKDRIRKDLFRLQLQQSLLSYAQIVLAMDEMVKELKSEYPSDPDLGTPLKFVALSEVVPVSNDIPRQQSAIPPQVVEQKQQTDDPINRAVIGMYQISMSSPKLGVRQFFANFRSDSWIMFKGEKLGVWKVEKGNLAISFTKPEASGTIQIKSGGFAGSLTDKSQQSWKTAGYKLSAIWWEVKLGDAAPFTHCFWSNGRIGEPDSLSSWRVNGGEIVLSWANGGIDKLKFGADRRRFEGRNQNGTPMSGRLVEK
jgi:hypothetical protein